MKSNRVDVMRGPLVPVRTQLSLHQHVVTNTQTWMVCCSKCGYLGYGFTAARPDTNFTQADAIRVAAKHLCKEAA